MAIFLRSIHTADYDTYKLLVFQEVWHFKKDIKQFVFCIVDVFITLKECITILSKCKYYRENYVFTCLKSIILIKTLDQDKKYVQTTPVVVDRDHLMSLRCFLL